MFWKNSLKPRAYVSLLRITCFFWLIAKLTGWKVWLAWRLFPIIPPVETWQVPATVHLLLFTISLMCLISIIIIPRKKILLPLLLITELFSCALDQNRWQPWEYQYLFTLFAFIVYRATRTMSCGR